MLSGGYRNPEAIAAERLLAAGRELASLEVEVSAIRSRRQTVNRALHDTLWGSSRGLAAAGFVVGVALGFSLVLLGLRVLAF